MVELDLCELEALSNMLDEKGEDCDLGCDEETAESIRNRLELLNKTKCIRLVKNWTIWDLSVSDEMVAELKSRGFNPSMVYSSFIIWDRYAPDSVGTCVRSTLLIELFDRCVFETKNTYYILVGVGSRKLVDPKIALAIFF